MFQVFRYAIFVIFVLSAAAAFGSWAVRTRRINPFSPLAKIIRQLTDPLLQPIEQWQLRRGGNPQQAPWWLLGITLVGGILLITLTQWVFVQAARVMAATGAGPRGVIRLVVYYAGQLVLLAIIVRVIGSWVGVFRYSKWMRPVYFLTDWIIEPLRRIIPPLGPIDITPLIAWIALQILLGWLMRVL